jgi:group II intron reverse transcriptase/maturase
MLSPQSKEVCEMQSADVYLGLVRERGNKGLPLKRVYRQLFHRDLYLLAYGKIYRNHGAMTKGSTEETVDGMSLAKIDAIIDALRQERYQWKPVRRVYIEKKRSTKKRALGLPDWSDKLLQEVIRLILTAYFEPSFSDHSHGFRPERGCHTALRDIYETWAGTTWFLEGDISQCFDSLSHDLLLEILAEHLPDGRFLRLIRGLLQAGYLENWTWNRTFSGAPQGSIIGPILSNIYLTKLDQFVEQTLLPAHTRGDRRRANPTYTQINNAICRKRKQGKTAVVKRLEHERRKLPSVDPSDPTYRRLRYCRYADDFLVGFIGPQAEVEEIKQHIGAFLHDQLKLELSQTKTLITHARSEAAQFLGYDLSTFQRNDACESSYRKRRVLNGKVELSLPKRVIQEQCQRYMAHNKPIHRAEMQNDTVFTIMAHYQGVYRGVVEYYRMAHNLHQLNKLKWIMETSLTKTLAAKLRVSVSKVYERYHATLLVNQQSYKGLQVVIQREGRKPLIAQWGGIPLHRRMDMPLKDTSSPFWSARVELIQRLLAETCELCGSQTALEVHHIRALKDLKRPGRSEKPTWVKTMAARHRKTLVVCRACHQDIHCGRPLETTHVS